MTAFTLNLNRFDKDYIHQPSPLNNQTVIFSLHPSTYSLSKRCIDIIGSLIGLLILGILFLPIAIAIKLDSCGDIFYSQTRHGLYGKPFKIWKFRSMIPQADTLKSKISNQVRGHLFKNDNDPRITPVGRFLRGTSLDEFPQFWNVLIGDMSLVGTRPPTEDEVIYYTPHHWQRLNVKPGITGEWQVNGRSQVQDFEAVVALDLNYQKQWHPGYDLMIIWKTISVVFTRLGAC